MGSAGEWYLARAAGRGRGDGMSNEDRVIPHSLLRFAAPRAFRFCGRGIIALIAALLPLSSISTFAQSSPPPKLQKVTALYGAGSGASWLRRRGKGAGY